VPHNPLVILGSGYTARFLWPLVADRSPKVFATSRAPEQHLSYVPPVQCLRFDLSQPDTWGNIPRDADLLWCFPAAPLDLVRQFITSLSDSNRRLVVLGSTSAYDQGDSQVYPPPWIDETAPIDLTKPRVQGEEYLRREQGAIVLRVAGIYGPGRNPLDWIRTGRVKPSRKYVNLIHVEDLAAICLAALEQGTPGEAYNVSDGIQRTWEEICLTAEQRWNVHSLQTAVTQDAGKRISNTKLTQQLGYTIQHSDLYKELQLL
jgi:nucleoside-diphosphate-sugar epimerase